MRIGFIFIIALLSLSSSFAPATTKTCNFEVVKGKVLVPDFKGADKQLLMERLEKAYDVSPDYYKLMLCNLMKTVTIGDSGLTGYSGTADYDFGIWFNGAMVLHYPTFSDYMSAYDYRKLSKYMPTPIDYVSVNDSASKNLPYYSSSTLNKPEIIILRIISHEMGHLLEDTYPGKIADFLKLPAAEDYGFKIPQDMGQFYETLFAGSHASALSRILPSETFTEAFSEHLMSEVNGELTFHLNGRDIDLYERFRNPSHPNMVHKMKVIQEIIEKFKADNADTIIK